MIPEIKLKQYIFIPKRPKMSPGKLASQGCHATFMALDKQMYHSGTKKFNINTKGCRLIDEWKENGMCVIVLQCKNTEQLTNISKYLDQWKVPNHLYIDEGHTEVDPMTPTALATGVIPIDKHWMFSQFKLYK